MSGVVQRTRCLVILKAGVDCTRHLVEEGGVIPRMEGGNSSLFSIPMFYMLFFGLSSATRSRFFNVFFFSTTGVCFKSLRYEIQSVTFLFLLFF